MRFLQQEYALFPNAHGTLEDMIAEGNPVVFRHCFQATQKSYLKAYPSSGNGVLADYIAIRRLVKNRLVKAWMQWDNLSWLAQLGHVHPQ